MILLKDEDELRYLRESNHIVAQTLELLARHLQPGITTAELDRLAEDFICRQGGRPAFKGYRGFPASACISINDQVVHGIPGPRKVRNGDIVSIDIGVLKHGFYGDAAATFPAGNVPPAARKLMQVTRESLSRGIDQLQAGNRLSDYSRTVQQYVERHGCSVVRDFVGHGIGRSLHEEPQIPNFYLPSTFDLRLKPGMVMSLEPMVNQGSWKVRVLKDGWTAVTRDGSLSAHYEHTVAITEDGPWILSALDGD